MPIAPRQPKTHGLAKSPLADRGAMPAFWGWSSAAGYGLAFSAMSFHLIPLLA